MGTEAASHAAGHAPHHRPRDNGLGQRRGGRRCRERVRPPGAPRRVGNCFSCTALEHRGRSLVAHLVLSMPAVPRGERERGARRRDPGPDICHQPRGPRRRGAAGDAGTRGLPKACGALMAPTSAGKLLGGGHGAGAAASSPRPQNLVPEALGMVSGRNQVGQGLLSCSLMLRRGQGEASVPLLGWGSSRGWRALVQGGLRRPWRVVGHGGTTPPGVCRRQDSVWPSRARSAGLTDGCSG